MQMFESFLNSIPKSRSEMVEDLEIPEVSPSPYMWEPDDSLIGLTTRSDSLLTTSTDEGEVMTYSTDSSIPLSRAMTDSDIDYERSKRYKSRSICDPWDQMRIALDAFPPEYLESLTSFQISSSETEQRQPPTRCVRRRYDEELRQKMHKFFAELQVFAPDDPALEELEDALATVDMKKIIDAELQDKKP